jgi:hypothetical protein
MDESWWIEFEAHAPRFRASMRRAAWGSDADEMVNDLRLRVWRAAQAGAFDGRTPGAMIAYASQAAPHVAVDARLYAARSRHSSRAGTWAPTCSAGMESELERIVDGYDPDRRTWREQFWTILSPLLRTPAERVAVGCFAAGIMPKVAVQHWPHLFADVAAVYADQKRAVSRIRRSGSGKAALLALREEAA